MLSIEHSINSNVKYRQTMITIGVKIEFNQKSNKINQLMDENTEYSIIGPKLKQINDFNKKSNKKINIWMEYIQRHIKMTIKFWIIEVLFLGIKWEDM